MTERSADTERPRILLVSEDFSKEVTTSVLWLNESGLDIRCVRLRVYRHGDELLIDVDQVIPLPEAQDYLVRVRNKAEESQQRAGSGRLVAGAGDFEAAIDSAPQEHRPNLTRLLKWALSIEEAGHAKLYTYHWKNGEGISLLPRLQPEYKSGLVTILNDHGAPHVAFNGTVFDRRAPQFIAQIENVLDRPLGKSIRTRKIDSHILDLVRKAYEEASALRSTM